MASPQGKNKSNAFSKLTEYKVVHLWTPVTKGRLSFGTCFGVLEWMGFTMKNLTIFLASSVICFLSSPAFAHRIAPMIEDDSRDQEPMAARPLAPTLADPTRIA